MKKETSAYFGIKMDNYLSHVPDDILLDFFNGEYRRLVECQSKYPEDEWYADKVSKMESAIKNGEETFFIRQEFESGNYEIYDMIDLGPFFMQRFCNSLVLGIDIMTLIKIFPDWTLGSIKQHIAEELNKMLGTLYTEEDVECFSEGG